MINWARIEELRREVGDDGYAELRDVFLAEVEEVLGTLDPAAGQAALERQLHFLKGSALNLGLSALAARCNEGEVAAARGTLAPGLIGEVRALYLSSRAALMAGAHDPT